MQESEGIEARLAHVRARVKAACERAERDPATVRILPVSKTFGPDRVDEAVACGLTVMAENRVQEALAKAPRCSSSIAWHLVGHLQRNKVREAVTLFSMVHSVDSWRLLETIERVCEEGGQQVPVCLQVNVSGESSKSGVAPADVPDLVARAAGLQRVSLTGLMTIPPFAEDPEAARPYFRALRELRDRCGQETGVDLAELSMGMSHDFECAIEEGATWIRLGTLLFGRRRSAGWQQVAAEDSFE